MVSHFLSQTQEVKLYNGNVQSQISVQNIYPQCSQCQEKKMKESFRDCQCRMSGEGCVELEAEQSAIHDTILLCIQG